MYQVFPNSIPAELKPGRVWVCHDRDKVPMVATKRGRRAKSTDPSTWCSFEEALDASRAGWHAGIGRVIVRGEGLAGVDLDHCRNPETGAITPRAREILERLDSYSEVSPSGCGVKVWARAEDVRHSHSKPGVEVYPHGRYFTTTGQILSQYAANIEERSSALAEVIAAEFPQRKRSYSPREASARNGRSHGRRIDLGGFLEGARVEILREVADREAALKYQILCPWIEEHTKAPESGTYAGQYPSGTPFFWCWHSHCWHRHWGDFVRAVAPNIQTIRVAPRGCTGAYLEVISSRG